jgi:hypothetical protein
MDAGGDDMFDASGEDGVFVLVGTKEEAPAGVISADRVARAQSPEEVFGCEEDGDELAGAPASHRAGAAGLIGGGKKVERIEEDVLFEAEGLAQAVYLVPVLDECCCVSQSCGSIPFLDQGWARMSNFSF